MLLLALVFTMGGAFAQKTKSSSSAMKVPAQFVVDLYEKGGMKVMGKKGDPGKFVEIITPYFEQYKKAGATKLPALKLRTHGTVTMGIRQELETEFAEVKSKYEKAMH